MKTNKPLSVVVASALIISILAPYKGRAEVASPVQEAITNELLDIQMLSLAETQGLDIRLVETVFSTITPETKARLKELVAVWASQGYLINPNAQLGIVQVGGKSEILDAAEEELSPMENDILNLLTALHFENKLIPFVSTLIEILKNDAKYGALVSTVTSEQKLLILSVLDQTMTSTAQLRSFSKQSWIQLSHDLELKLNRFDSDKENQTRLSDANFMRELLDVANAKFYTTQNVELLIDGPASFSKRDKKMAEAKESINMLTWAVLDDKTGSELADLLIAKAKSGIKVRLIVDGQVSQRKGYTREVKRMEENGVSVIRWLNPLAKFMGQHRKILIIDESLVIMGGMNPGDTYSHKAGVEKYLWRDTDISFEGELVEQAQRLFTSIWNKQIFDQKLNLKKIIKVKKTIAIAGGSKAMIIEHQPKAIGDQHEILLATMKAIRGAEKTVDIENAYVIVFPSLLREIKAAIDRGVKVRVLTNSTDSVDEPVVALPIVRSAKKLMDVGAEVYLKKGSTLHSKFMVVDDRLLLIGSYNYHPRSEKLEGESIALFDDVKIATEARQAFDKDITAENAVKMDSVQEVVIPVNGTTLLPLRMFYDQL